MTKTNETLQSVTNRTKQNQPRRAQLSCTNFAHAVAAASALDKITLHQERAINLAIVSAYNDMLSAHQPFEENRSRPRCICTVRRWCACNV